MEVLDIGELEIEAIGTRRRTGKSIGLKGTGEQ